MRHPKTRSANVGEIFNIACCACEFQRANFNREDESPKSDIENLAYVGAPSICTAREFSGVPFFRRDSREKNTGASRSFADY